MKKKSIFILIGIVVLALIGYFNSKNYEKGKNNATTQIINNDIKDSGELISTKESKRESIKKDNSPFWKEFDPIVKERIYELIENKDC